MVMKKVGLFLIGGISAIILLHSIGPIVGLVVSLAILYFIYKQFIKTESTLWKVVCIIFGLMVLSSTIHHIPALIGLGAAYVLYLVYKEWNKSKKTFENDESDPFVHFERQWDELKKH
jgi:lia operon protein LiaI